MTPTEFEAFFLSHQKSSQTRRHRLVVLLQGGREDLLGFVEYLTAKTRFTKIVYRSERQGDKTDVPLGSELNLSWEVISGRNVQKVLGTETDVVIYDGFCGIDPDMFGALTGSVVAGGVLFLLLPEVVPEQVAKDYLTRYWPHLYPVTSRQLFLTRLYGLFCEHDDVIKYSLNAGDMDELPRQVNQKLKVLNPAPSSLISDVSQHPDTLTDDQLIALGKINSVVSGHGRRPLIITADRGRGKSFLLGYAAAECQKKQARKVCITASLKSSAAVALAAAEAHGQALLDLAVSSATSLKFQNGGSVSFVAVDDLVESYHDCDVLFVDEAASIPTFILEKLLRRYNRIVFSSTVHGYEGHGRGFSISFRKLLPLHVKQWSEAVLVEPIRWAQNDPLEAVTNAGLLLDSDYREGCNLSPEVSESKVLHYEWVGKEALIAEDALLQAVFGLLVSAHYQTSPSDLLILLDAPNTYLLIACEPSENPSLKPVVGVCLVCVEGGFSEALDQAIAEGRRRVRGHLAPQSLAFHGGCRGGAMLRCLRVMRIAIASSHQRRGIATALLNNAQQFCAALHLDYFVTSFSATPEVCEFWAHSGLSLLRVGVSKDSSSGSYSILMGKSMTEAAHGLFTELRKKLGYALKYQFITHYQTMLAETAFFVFSHTEPAAQSHIATPNIAAINIDSAIDSDVESFCQGQRHYDLCAGAIFEWLWRVERHKLLNCDNLSREILVRRVLQGLSVAAVCKELNISGEKELVTMLRKALAALKQQAPAGVVKN
ncbi:MAG: tRNA(Met) cytidine acetyltransferase [Hahellaceae bacterium]|nr:tRNA(Met) cytidine acetyltransferase [Hahellaceae bacterium]MCP5212116.1 tRNA(Met) cytidine acetyltransferase [Hahellaceae bacterium]